MVGRGRFNLKNKKTRIKEKRVFGARKKLILQM
jgi:hypothetical protein